LDLLRTTAVVDGNENFDIRNDLLDQDLESRILGKPGQLPIFQRAPYKGVGNFQTGKCWKSPQLSVKDHNKSTPNSILVDVARPATAGASLSSESEWDNDSSQSQVQLSTPMDASSDLQQNLPLLLLHWPNWIQPATCTQISNLLGDSDNVTCSICRQEFKTNKRPKVHALQRFITTFCPCGKFSYNRDYVLRHQRTMKCYIGHLF